MNSLLYIIAFILVVGWAIGLLFTVAGSMIHLLLIVAVIVFLFGVIRKPTAI